MSIANLPVAIVGAGPVGLAAAAHLNERGVDFLLFEAGDAVGAHVRRWGHVRLFSAWAQNIDDACARLLRAAGGRWLPPASSHIPKGEELVADYLAPLAATPSIAQRLRLRRRVRAIARLNASRSSNVDRAGRPFVLYIEVDAPGGRQSDVVLARAVIDATGVIDAPMPLGANGLSVPGETESRSRFTYGVPSPEQLTTIGERILIAGSGHSAMQSIVALVRSAGGRARQLEWALRRDNATSMWSCSGADRFPARLVLQAKVREAVDGARVRLHLRAAAAQVKAVQDGVEVTWADGAARTFDHVVVATGYKPDHTMLSELQTAFDPVFQAPAGMQRIIHGAQGACAAVPEHGEAELRHPEPGCYVAGVRSFGRAPSFLMRAGYEQVRSIAAALAGAGADSAPRPFAAIEPMTLTDFLRQHPYYLEKAFA